MISPAKHAYDVSHSLRSDRTRIRWAIAGSITLHGLLALFLSFFIKSWLLPEQRITLPQSKNDLEISILYRVPTQEPLVQQKAAREISTAQPSKVEKPKKFFTEEGLVDVKSELATTDSIVVARHVLRTKVDSLFALLDEYPELKRVVFRELLLNPPPRVDSSENFRLALARSLARFYEGSAQYGIIQRKDWIYVSPYDPFRPHGLTNSIDFVGLILAIVELSEKLSSKK